MYEVSEHELNREIDVSDYDEKWLKIVNIVAVLGIMLAIGMFSIGVYINIDFDNFLSEKNYFVGGFILFFTTIKIIACIGVLLKKAWGKYLMFFVAALSLFNLPLGTVFGAIMLIGLNKNAHIYR